MKTAHRIAAYSLLGSTLALAWATGCTVKSDDRFVGTPIPYNANWLSGGAVSVSNVNGDINVDQGSGDVVNATFTPFVLLAYDTSKEDAKVALEKLVTNFQADTPIPGSVVISDSRADGASTTLGATIDVGLPPAFDGPLAVHVSNGGMNVSFVGNASAIDFKSDNGSCHVVTGAAAKSVNVNCDNGQVVASMAGVPADSQGGNFVSGNGDISLGLPGSAKFTIQAQAMSGGRVDVGNAVAAGCTVVDGGSTSAQTVSCGGATAADPVYHATASGLGDIALSF